MLLKKMAPRLSAAAQISAARQLLPGSHMTVPLIDLRKTRAFSDASSHCEIAAQPLTRSYPDSFVQFCFTGCSLCCICSLSASFPYVVAIICAGRRCLQASLQSTVPWSGALLLCPGSCCSCLMGMWCVAVEMTLTIHISNDLKQFTLQLKQDLSCDNPEEIVTC